MSRFRWPPAVVTAVLLKSAPVSTSVGPMAEAWVKIAAHSSEMLRIAALVVKADQVAQRVIAKDDLQVFVTALHAPGPVQHFGMTQVPLPVAREIGRAHV